jgi:hypothetical protein
MRGDTIVEVMISMVVLALVIAATYSLSTRAFRSGLNSQYRDQAVSYAQQQLELIKEADLNTPQTIDNYTTSPNTAFCIDPGTKAKLGAGSCVIDDFYTVTYKYDDVKKRFTVTASWDSANGTTQQALVYYKPTNSFSGSLQPPCRADDPLCASTQTNVPAISLTSDKPQYNIGEAAILTWNSANVNSCSASGPAGSGFTSPPVNANANPGNFTTQPLNTSGDNIFKITCSDNAGNPVIGSVTVTVLPPTIDYFRVNGVNAPTTASISYKDNVTVSWSASNVTGCTAVGPWSTGGASSGSVTAGRYAGNTTLGLSCTKSGGGTITAPDINISVGPSGIYGYYYRGANFDTFISGPYNDGIVNWCSSTGGYICENGWVPTMQARTGTPSVACASAYWYGNVLADSGGTYVFGTDSDDGVNVWVDGNNIISNWSQHLATFDQGSINLSAGWHTIQVNYQNNNGGGCGSDPYSAVIRLFWAPPGNDIGSRIVLPQDHLRPF